MPNIRRAHSGSLLGIALLLVLAAVPPAAAKTLLVGDDQPLKTPSAAAAVATDGDTVVISPHAGGYFDCAIWKQNHLTIEGKGAGVIITDKTCAGKGLFVIDGDDVTIRNLTFQRARVPDQNGAGVRTEGGTVHVEKSRFINNENGILGGGTAKTTLTIVDSEFIGNGKCSPTCAHGIYIGHIGLLHVEHSTFRETKEGHHIKSRALRTEIVGCTIEDGDKGNSSYLVDIPNGGALVMRDNTLEKGPNSQNHSAAVIIGEEGVDQPTSEITITGNKFTNDLPMQTTFIRNGTATEANLTGNTLKGKVEALNGDGKTH
jgi:hypothetical protein